VRGRKALAALCAAALQDQTAILGGHTGPEAVRLGTTTIVRLKSALGHSYRFSVSNKRVRLSALWKSVKKSGQWTVVGGQLKADSSLSTDH
jgi:hypothetical protein